MKKERNESRQKRKEILEVMKRPNKLVVSQPPSI